MYVTSVPNRNSPPAILLRESYRDGDKVKTRTLANLSSWPPAKVAALQAVLRGQAIAPAPAALVIRRSLPHGHVAAVLGTAQRIGLDRLLGRADEHQAKLAMAMIVARVVDPASKLATAAQLAPDTATSTLGELLDLGPLDQDDLYATLDWLVTQQARIEAALARRHLREGTLVLYDVTSSYLEGRHCELARHGYSRDGKADKLQIVFGLICTATGCPLAVEVFEGNTADPATLASQIVKLKQRFGLQRVVLVGDRGMLTAARIEETIKPAGLDWITTLRAPQIRALAGEKGPLQLSLFDQRDMAEIVAPDFPGERLIVCRNPLLAAERARKREELLQATEAELARIVAATQRRRKPLRGRDKIGLAIGAVLDQRHMAKHFLLDIADDAFSFRRNRDGIAAEALLDGIYVLRTALPAETLDAAATVRAYKGLSHAERAFRCLKMSDLEVRPIYHRRAKRVRAHVLLCMLAHHIEWHMRQRLAPILFQDDDKLSAELARSSPVAPAQRSWRARRKAARKCTDDGLPVHDWRGLLAHLATLTRNTVDLPDTDAFALLASPTNVQQRAFNLLGLKTLL